MAVGDSFVLAEHESDFAPPNTDITSWYICVLSKIFSGFDKVLLKGY